MKTDSLDRINQRIAENRERHKRDVEYVQAHHPELAAMLTEWTREFGKLDYRVSLIEKS